MRPTKIAYGSLIPKISGTVESWLGANFWVSTPFRIVTTFAGFTAGYAAKTSARIPSLTAMIAAADSNAVFSAHDEILYPPPN